MKDFVPHLKALQDPLGILHGTAVMPDLQKGLLENKKNQSLARHVRGPVNERGKRAMAIRAAALSKSRGDFSDPERRRTDAEARLARPPTGKGVFPDSKPERLFRSRGLL
ncbi:MAG: hypothetical protein U9Q81_26285 [Pseudomonadota bacterium]|nr:hypothetical protein [Pseudomonadota bacterium]